MNCSCRHYFPGVFGTERGLGATGVFSALLGTGEPGGKTARNVFVLFRCRNVPQGGNDQIIKCVNYRPEVLLGSWLHIKSVLRCLKTKNGISPQRDG